MKLLRGITSVLIAFEKVTIQPSENDLLLLTFHPIAVIIQILTSVDRSRPLGGGPKRPSQSRSKTCLPEDGNVISTSEDTSSKNNTRYTLHAYAHSLTFTEAHLSE